VAINILPFRGYRYAVAPARDISSVVAPPYDQISPEMQDRLLAMSAHNVVRLTLPKDEPSFDKYHRAQQVLEAWLADGVWAPEPRPAIYPYHQTYRTDDREITRVGFVTLGEVTDYARGIVRPHERTHAGPKQDRLRLLEATGADIGLLFMLTSDPDGALLEAVHPRGDAVAEAHDLRGELHQLWRITDDTTITRVQALMRSRSVIIADGHHRYETAVDYARRHPAARYKLMAFFTLEAPGLTILANHRVVHDVDDFSLDRLVERARAWFDVSPLSDPLQFTPTNRALHRGQARRPEPRRLHRRRGRGRAAGSRGPLPGGVPHRPHHCGGAAVRGRGRRAAAPEVDALLSEAAGRARVPPPAGGLM
jgi:uncharacterized protein (DUF1015 family)